MDQVRDLLVEMDEEIGPQSENRDYLEYATRCLSDANSAANRGWRMDFITERLAPLYGIEG